MDRKVLVIDDNPDFIELMKVILQHETTDQVFGDSTGQMSLEELQRYRPDLIILDLILPEVNGSELLLKLRANERWGKIPVLVLSAATVELRTLARDLKGMPRTAFMEKPFEIDALLRTMDQISRPLPAADCPAYMTCGA